MGLFLQPPRRFRARSHNRDLADNTVGRPKQIAIPADGLPGGIVIIPTSIDDAEAKAPFPQGWAEVCPNLRAMKL